VCFYNTVVLPYACLLCYCYPSLLCSAAHYEIQATAATATAAASDVATAAATAAAHAHSENVRVVAYQ
jgi:hypothetical protein